MIEIAFSALARGCLNRRIATREGLRRDVLAFVQEREAKRITLKMTAHYQRVYPDHPKFE